MPAKKGEEPGSYEYIKPYDDIGSDIENVSVNLSHSSAGESVNEEREAYEARYSANEFNKNKRDVNAQEGMWRAANALVFLTIIQVVVGAMTMIFLVLTFRTQRSELSAARDSAKATAKSVDVSIAQNRPYIGLEVISSKRTRKSTGGADYINIDAKVKNFGKTAARNVSLNGFLIEKDRTQNSSVFVSLSPVFKHQVYDVSSGVQDLVPDQETSLKAINWMQFRYNTALCKFFLRITYKSAFGAWHCEDYVFSIFSNYDSELQLVDQSRVEFIYGNITDRADIEGIHAENIPLRFYDPFSRGFFHMDVQYSN